MKTIPQNKQVQKLISLHTRFVLLVKNLPEDLTHKKIIEGFVKEETSICNVISYLIGWGNMLIEWYEQGLTGKDFVMPGQGFEKWDYAKIAQHFFQKYHQNTLTQQLALLEKTISQIVSIIKKEDAHGNIEKLGVWKWCTLKSGTQWPLSKWITVNSTAPCTRAITKIRKALKNNYDQRLKI